jgi:hypothetical protein
MLRRSNAIATPSRRASIQAHATQNRHHGSPTPLAAQIFVFIIVRRSFFDR